MKYNLVTTTTLPKTVTVITPTIGSHKLLDAIQSVKNQTYQYIDHLVVVDGPEYEKNFKHHFTYDYDLLEGITHTVSPFNTGGVGKGFYGHRIYASYPHLINTDYIFFLDEDNWYEPDHVESLVKVLGENDNQFAYSLRKIYDADKNYLLDDNCESLGRWPIYFTRGSKDESFLIDTSSFAFRREFLIQCCHLWHWGWGGDRRFYNFIRDQMHNTNGKHTLCYRLDGNPNSVTKDFFEVGNDAMRNFYGIKLPWIKD